MNRVMIILQTDDNLTALYDLLDEMPMITDYEVVQEWKKED